MAGNTGKMTAAAILARGPRLRLLGGMDGFVIVRDGMMPFRRDGILLKTYARSYSLSYLLNVGRGNSQPLETRNV